jgi:hypothetical protein
MLEGALTDTRYPKMGRSENGAEKERPMSTTVSLGKFVSDLLQAHATAPPDILWHYTNAAGFLGIFRSGKLWATNTDYLNDASEMRYARRLVWQAIERVRSSVTIREEHEMLNHFLQCVGDNAIRPVFVTSFSAEKNELSQWRAYGGSTGSFALGFNSAELVTAIARNTVTRFGLCKCLYDETESASLFQQVVANLLEDFRSLRAMSATGVLPYKEMDEFVHEAVRIFDTLAPLIKHPDFIKESEWRFVSDPVAVAKRPIRLREGKTQIIPYLELTIAPDKSDPRFTVHTLVGPSVNHDPRKASRAQIGYCDDFILQPFPIESSYTPFRHT